MLRQLLALPLPCGGRGLLRTKPSLPLSLSLSLSLSRSPRIQSLLHAGRSIGLSTCSRYMSSYGRQASTRLAGKTVLITGASSGIGKATALELASAAQGNLKLILAARRLDLLEALKMTIQAEFPQCEVLVRPLDISKWYIEEESIPNFIKSIPKEFAEIDVLVNNAGMVLGNEKVGEIKQSDIHTMFNTNVMGLITLTQAILPGMKSRGPSKSSTSGTGGTVGKGDIVNLGSIAGRDPYPGGSIYCATKAAVSSFSHALRKELIDTRIRVIEVQPGACETEFSLVRFRGDQSKADAVYEGTEPLLPEDVAEVITFALTRRENTVVAESLVFPSHQASATHIHRKSLK